MLPFNLRVLAFLFLFESYSSGVYAQCIGVIDPDSDLPHHLVTPGNSGISYYYDLEREEYRVEVSLDGRAGGPYGPFRLSVGCAAAALRWENKSFVLLENGCGTFCWYVLVLPIAAGEENVTIDRPLAFDPDRNLIAYYVDRDTIRIRNLVTGYEQESRTAIGCEYASGLCFERTRFTERTIEYTWREDAPARVFSMPLEDALLGDD